MSTWHYYNENNEKTGPITSKELKQLVLSGTITQKTIVENSEGRIATAEELTGLTFPTTVQAIHSSALKQLFCTNCGKPVSEQAAACMSCGVKPAGHKKFCRQCGVGLNADQVVCVKCGTKVAAGYQDVVKNLSTSFMSRVKQGAMSIFEKIKKWLKLMGILVIVVFAVVGLATFANNIFATMMVYQFETKPGDWTEYEITVSRDSRKEKIKFKTDILSDDGKKLRLQMTVYLSGPFGQMRDVKREFEIDRSKSKSKVIQSWLNGNMPVDMPANMRDFMDNLRKSGSFRSEDHRQKIKETTILTAAVNSIFRKIDMVA